MEGYNINEHEQFFYWMQGFIDGGGVTGDAGKKILCKMQEISTFETFKSEFLNDEVKMDDPLTEEQIDNLHPDIANAVGLSGKEPLPDGFFNDLEIMPEDLKPVGADIEQTTSGARLRNSDEIPLNMLIEENDPENRNATKDDLEKLSKNA